MVKVIYFILLMIVSLKLSATDVNMYHFNRDDDAIRFERLLKNTRCIVCQNQNLFESNALLAEDLRNKIYHLIKNKWSDQSITNYLVTRYGEFILLKPTFNQKTFFLWVFPLLAPIVAFALIFLWLKRYAY